MSWTLSIIHSTAGFVTRRRMRLSVSGTNTKRLWSGRNPNADSVDLRLLIWAILCRAASASSSRTRFRCERELFTEEERRRYCVFGDAAAIGVYVERRGGEAAVNGWFSDHWALFLRLRRRILAESMLVAPHLKRQDKNSATRLLGYWATEEQISRLRTMNRDGPDNQS